WLDGTCRETSTARGGEGGESLQSGLLDNRKALRHARARPQPPRLRVLRRPARRNSSSYENYDGQGARILEVEGLKAVLDKSVCCRKCGTGSVMFKDNFSRQQGTNNASFFECNTCSAVTPVPFSTVGSSKVFSLNQKMALASKMAGENLSTLKTLMVHHRFGESQNALI
ncbi:hypothetical protein GBAR_LOCUS25609, partial [Geodia barretti]